MYQHRIALAFVLAAAPRTADAWTPPDRVPEIADVNLHDIAAATLTSNGPVIRYNPAVANAVTPNVREFFYAHEYGHIYRGHLRNPESQTVPVWAQALEKEADCYAASVISHEAATEAYQFFVNYQGANRPDWLHPTGYERAGVIQQCYRAAHSTAPVDDAKPETHECHDVTKYETVTTYDTRYVTVYQQTMQCSVVMTYMGPQQVCMPMTVPRVVPQQVPVQQSVPRTYRACD